VKNFFLIYNFRNVSALIFAVGIFFVGSDGFFYFFDSVSLVGLVGFTFGVSGVYWFYEFRGNFFLGLFILSPFYVFLSLVFLCGFAFLVPESVYLMGFFSCWFLGYMIFCSFYCNVIFSYSIIAREGVFLSFNFSCLPVDRDIFRYSLCVLFFCSLPFCYIFMASVAELSSLRFFYFSLVFYMASVVFPSRSFARSVWPLFRVGRLFFKFMAAFLIFFSLIFNVFAFFQDFSLAGKVLILFADGIGWSYLCFLYNIEKLGRSSSRIVQER